MKQFIPVLCISILAACATTSAINRKSYEMLHEQGYGPAVAWLKQQADKYPRDVEVRSLLARFRASWMQELVMQADAAQRQGDSGRAEVLYRNVLQEDPANGRALAGLDTIRRARQHGQWLLEAREAAAREQDELALSGANRILSEDPANKGALELKNRLEDKRNRETLVSRKLKTAFRKKITLEFRDQSLRSIFEVISRSAGINFIFDKDVPPDLRATIFARNTTADDAIKVLLATNRLERKMLNETTLLIYPSTPDKLRENQELVTKSFYVTNADIAKTMNMIKLMVKTNDVYVDERLNMIVMRDTPEAIRVAEKLIAAHDVPDPEVTLEIEVLEVSDTRNSNVGVKLPSSVGFSVNGNKLVDKTIVEQGTTVRSLANLNGSGITVTGLSASIAAQLEDADVRTLANPRIRVRNREKAKILIGEKVPIFTTSTTNNVTSSSVQYQDVGLTVRAEPVIHNDGNVSVKLYLEVSSLGNLVTDGGTNSATSAYRIGSRVAETVLRLRDGETQMLAGLINQEERTTYTRVPGIGDIPLLGHLFGATQGSKGNSEIVLLITPRIVRGLERPDAHVTEFSSGTAAQLSDQPLYLNNTEAISPNAAQPGEFPSPQPAAPAPAPTPAVTPAPVTIPPPPPEGGPASASRPAGDFPSSSSPPPAPAPAPATTPAPAASPASPATSQAAPASAPAASAAPAQAR